MKRDILILLIISSIILLFNLGAGSLSSWDEAIYAQISREMLQTGNWVDLRWGGVPWADKPPLYMWATVVFYRLFGVNEFSARLFSCLAGITLVVFTYLFAGDIFSRRTAFISAVMLLSTYHFVWFSKMGTLDIAFTLFVTLAIYSFFRSEKNRVSIMYSFIWFGFAFLTKGVAAFLIPMILGVYVLAVRQGRIICSRYTLFGVLIFLVMVGSWYFLAFLHYGRSFLQGQFFQHLVHRTTATMDGHYGNWLTYLNVILYKGKPWGAFGLMALPFFVFQSVRREKKGEHLLALWVLTVIVVFSIFRTKLHWYVMPAYPALVMIAGWGMDALFRRYSVVFVFTVSLFSLVYFGAEKGIFSLDYNPEVKRFANAVRKAASNDEVYLYATGDPGLRFYFGGFSRNIRSKAELLEILKRKGVIIVAKSGDLDDFNIHGKTVPAGWADIMAIRIE